MLPHYLVKCTNFSSFSFFSRVSSTINPRYGRVVEASCCDIAGFQHSVVDDAVDQWQKRLQKVVTLNICCNVACLTFHLSRITSSQPVLFRATNANTQSAFQIHQRLEECNIPSVGNAEIARLDIAGLDIDGLDNDGRMCG